MTICNACRYCEGYCAVFPAMERRREFTPTDLAYLANLCHSCGACLPACQYAPPHEFAVNVPQTLAQIRLAAYRSAVAPAVLRSAFGSVKLTLLAAAVSLLVFVLATLLLAGPQVVFSRHDGGAFFAVVSHSAMVTVFSLAGLYALVALAAGVVRFRELSGDATLNGRAFLRGLRDALQLVNLEGGGEGCADVGETPSSSRRVLHHLTFYGFMVCFLATVVAAFYDNFLGWRAPYPLWSLPVILGTVGGVTLLIGSAGLLYLIGKRDPALTDARQKGMDVAFIILLLLTAVTGLLLLALRSTAAMGSLLAVHLGVVLGLFVTMPYGKFVHGLYRIAALMRYAGERVD